MLLTVAVVLIAGVAVWLLLAANWRSDVAVAWGTAARAGEAGAPSCRDAVVRTRRLESGVRTPVLPARPGMDCRLPVTLTNNSPVTVRLETIVLPYMGTDAGAEIQVKDLAGLPRAPQHSEDGLHAAFAVGRELVPGESYRVTVRFTHRDAGCSAELTWLGQFPTVVISALGVPGQVSSTRTLAFRGTGTTTGCSG